ncbi:hypothetical protein DJ010_13445 [Nocardioides silvaticus]|uniref:Uncharacterized protein n=1 Tax=Nocardioides silvaticus TaxID=2201891 RepID=A0A316TIQ2_9ACTN|nr:hypothetical protein DJ010_13445 [Nocardioides silvaticus]
MAPQPRWRDRVFRMRAVAAVAVAGVILGAAGGAATTALVSDSHPDRSGEQRFGPMFHPGMPGLPPGGQMRFPGDESDGQSSDDEPLPADPSSEPSSSESAS